MAVTYSYKGILGNKYTDGKIVAINKEEAAFKLKEDKIIITSLEKVSGKEEVIKEKKRGKSNKKSKKDSKKSPYKRGHYLYEKIRNHGPCWITYS
jgi:type IV pilus assembly protein PilC